ncbi:hypothetical protein DFH06DRAFT_376752 [Mycena polygramma]|nr:hypothetical protein DFH06DRAFT_376752 [Mycena polygramma]
METNQSLRDRLAEIDAQLAVLQAERRNIQKRLNSLRYPVLTLPFEVTSEIFTHCLPRDVKNSEPIFNFSRDRLPAALLLSQICRSWRHVALTTPKIWAIFRLPVGYRLSVDNTLAPRQSRHLAEWVGRVRSSPFSFFLDRTDIYYGARGSQHLHPTILHIISLSSQWLEVHLRLTHADLVTEGFRSGLRGRLPSLQTLRIKTGGSSETVVDAFEHAPNLRTVVLDGLRPTSILLPWYQLTHFTGTSLDDLDCFEVLRSAVSLVECRLSGAQGDVDDTELLPPHLGLEVLYLTGYCLCSDLLFILTLPALLELDFDDGNGNECHKEFTEFLSRSRPPLHRLSIHRGYQLLVHGVPLLLHLAVLEINLSVAEMADFLHTLRDHDPSVFLPNLRSVVVSVWATERSWDAPRTPTVLHYGDLVVLSSTDGTEITPALNWNVSR